MSDPRHNNSEGPASNRFTEQPTQLHSDLEQTVINRVEDTSLSSEQVTADTPRLRDDMAVRGRSWEVPLGQFTEGRGQYPRPSRTGLQGVHPGTSPNVYLGGHVDVEAPLSQPLITLRQRMESNMRRAQDDVGRGRPQTLNEQDPGHQGLDPAADFLMEAELDNIFAGNHGVEELYGEPEPTPAGTSREERMRALRSRRAQDRWRRRAAGDAELERGWRPVEGLELPVSWVRGDRTGVEIQRVMTRENSGEPRGSLQRGSRAVGGAVPRLVQDRVLGGAVERQGRSRPVQKYRQTSFRYGAFPPQSSRGVVPKGTVRRRERKRGYDGSGNVLSDEDDG